MSYSRRRRQPNWIEEPSGYSDINLGFGVHQQRLLEEARNSRRVQTLTLKPRPIEQQKRLCTQCHGRLEWLEDNRRFICYSCAVTYSENFNTLPSSNDQQIKPLQDNSPYANNKPYFKNIEVNRRLAGETESDTIEETRTYHNGRVKYIKLRPGISPAAYSIREDINNNDQR